jgi:signal transduction histidine kinase
MLHGGMRVDVTALRTIVVLSADTHGLAREVVSTRRDEPDCVRLAVQDAGLGFDPQSVERLFEAFYTTKRKGIGIGLSVSRSIIESDHGRLWATANEGPGATFAFSIPREAGGA